MGSCCSVDGGEQATATAICPRCGQPGRSVERITLKALLKADALARLSPDPYRFCPTPACEVVYFGPDSVFIGGDVSVPVFQKDPAGERTVCYCFDVTESDLRRELVDGERPTASERITALVKADRCACEVRNPQGSCCLGNITSVVQDLQGEVASAR
jgi:hypothetical protein